MDLFDQLRQLLEALRESGLDYALCGGLALAAHGIVRATEDIDLMVQKDDLTKIRAAVRPLGFKPQARPFRFKKGKVTMYRFLKTDRQDFVILDMLAVTPATRPAWETRSQLDTELGSVSVVSRAGLIQLKKLRASGQDLDDIKELKQHGRRHGR